MSPFWDDWYDPWFGPSYSPYYPPAINYNFYNGTANPYPPDNNPPDNNPYPPNASESSPNSAQESSQSVPNTTTPPKATQDSLQGVLIFLKDGSVRNASNAWLLNGNLHYTRTDNGKEDEVGIDQVDWQITIEENAKRGVPFTLTPKPSADKALDPTNPKASI